LKQVNRGQVMGCLGAPQVDQPVFGIIPTQFKAQTGFADFLYTVADAGLVSRAGEVQDTSEFLDSSTEQVLVLFVFFTPRDGIVSLLNINCDLRGPTDLSVSVTVDHYGIIEGQQVMRTLAESSWGGPQVVSLF
jgi:hypothetical protein